VGIALSKCSQTKQQSTTIHCVSFCVSPVLLITSANFRCCSQELIN